MNIRMITLIALAVLFMAGAAGAVATTDSVEMRGEVKEGDYANPIVNPEWDATNFAGCWYDLDAGTSTETLKINATLHNCARTIGNSKLIYTTDTSEKTYAVCKKYPEVKIEDKSVYYIEGWMAEKYVALGAMKTDKLCKLLVEFKDGDEETLYTGDKWNLSGGFALELVEIDEAGNKAALRLFKDGDPLNGSLKYIDASAGATDQMRTYVYAEDICGVDNVPVFHCYVAAVFKGDISYVQLTHAFLIDNDVMEIRTGDSYGIMEVTKASGGVELKNKDNSVDLSTDSTEQIMGDMYFKTADDDDYLRFYPMVEKTEPGTYEIRGTVKEGNNANPIIGPGDLTWDAHNFAAFWYDLDAGTSTETLKITATLDNQSRTIADARLIYTTGTSAKTYKVCKKYPGVKIVDKQVYYVEGWMAEMYVALGETKTDKLCKLLELDGDEKTLYTGDKWNLSGGFALELMGIDEAGNKATLRLFKDGDPLERSLKCIDASAGATDQMRTYIYTEDIGGVDNVPVFHCYVAAVFKGDISYVQLTHAFLIDNDVLEIKTGDTYGIMEVTKASGGVELKNKDNSIDLSTDSTEHIMGDMYFKTADDDDYLRFYPFVERTIGGEEPILPVYIPADDADGDGVPDVWDADNSTQEGYWVNPQGIGRRWGDMNGDGVLTSVDALMILQAAAGKIGL